jgi:hypothetical protein
MIYYSHENTIFLLIMPKISRNIKNVEHELIVKSELDEVIQLGRDNDRQYSWMIMERKVEAKLTFEPTRAST